MIVRATGAETMDRSCRSRWCNCAVTADAEMLELFLLPGPSWIHEEGTTDGKGGADS
jgi:hypothetical protein